MTLGTQQDHACLIVKGPDQQGLVAAITALVARNDGNIVSLDQYSDNPAGGKFFQRLVFHRPGLASAMDAIRADIEQTLSPYGMEWRLTDQSVPKRMIILASKSDHCLLDLLWRQRRGELAVTIPKVISNHTNSQEDVENFGIEFVHVPSQEGPDKSQSEAELLKQIVGQADFVVLARYMQILSDEFIEKLGVPVINIHHSFLPAFIGAPPYRRAKERGVKLIGATAHYVTKDLDEGPIIEQDVTRISHDLTVEDLQVKGQYVERGVLSRAVQWHAEDRVIRDGNHTVVFSHW